MDFLNDFFSNVFIYSFGWTLIHSLVHGAVISFLTLMILFFLRNQSSYVRYQVIVSSMMIVVVLSIWTFISIHDYYNELYSANSESVNISNGSNSITNFGIFWLDVLPENLIINLTQLSNYLPLVFTTWLFIVLFLSLKYLGQFAYTQRLKTNKTKLVTEYWRDKLCELSNKVKLKQKVKLLESAMVKVPLVIGYFKPVILVPTGLFLGIPEEQVEAILIHELAHIKRKDYLVKLLQTVVEIIFFFNPFVWWISSTIDKEREHCCDELAISVTKDNIAFVRALAGLCELTVKNTGYALTFGKSNNLIIKRMERVMKKNEKKDYGSQFIIAVTVLMISLVALGATTVKFAETKVESKVDVISKSDNNLTSDQDAKKKNKKLSIEEIDKNIKKVKMALKEETDPEKKKKLEGKLKYLWKEKEAIKKTGKKEMSKKEIDDLIVKIKQKLENTTDEETRKQLKKKLKYQEEQAAKHK